MSTEILVKIENTPTDPFWLGHSSLPFRSDFSGDGFEDDDGVTVSRGGTEILAEAVTLWSALKPAINELRRVYVEQQRYLSERTAEGFAKRFDALPDDLRTAGKDAAGIAKILDKVAEDPVKKAFWVSNAAVLLDQLRERLHTITLTVAAAKAQSERGERK